MDLPNQEAASGPEENYWISVSLGTSTPTAGQVILKSQDCWCPPGRAVMVRGRSLPDGMLYVGSQLASVSEYIIEPALINPHLPVSEGTSNYEGLEMPYWPSYSDIQPPSRSAYLEWLAGGRSHPRAYIGYVFLFLYGLERRVLFDFEQLPDVKSELPAIINEIERLLSIYQENRSFKKYASQLLDIARIQSSGEANPGQVRKASGVGGQLPPLLRVAVGRLARDRKALPVEWALTWVNCDPEMPIRTPGRRCRREFEALFAAKYAARYGEGCALKECKRQTVIDYQPASGSFPRRFTVAVPVPDISSLLDPRRALAGIVTECCDALEPLSRLRGKEPQAQSAIVETSVLPAELLASHGPSELAALRQGLEDLMGDREIAVLQASAAFGSWAPTAEEKPTKASSALLLQVVQRIGFCVEPDVRFGGPPIARTDQVAVFRATDSDSTTPSAAYSSASLLLHLGTCVAQTDGSLAESELRHLLDHLGSALFLAQPERRRLRAHLSWLAAAPPSTARLKKRIAALDETQRQEAGRFLVSVALADGRVEPSEVKSLVKIFRLLGLDPAGVHEVIHAIQAGVPSDGLARVKAIEPAAADYSIPAPSEQSRTVSPVQPTGPRPLDMETVEAKMRESARIAALLGEILAPEDEPVAPTAHSAPLPDGNRIRSLDERHSRLLRALGERSTWSREEYERLAAGVGLLPDGALEVLNEMAFEACDALLVEGDDPIGLDEGVYAELLK